MYIQKIILFVLTIFFAFSCNEQTCNGLDPIVTDYLPPETVGSAKYTSTEGTSFLFTFENNISKPYSYYEWCKTCECGQGARMVGTAKSGGEDFEIEYTIKDEILQQTRTGIWENIKEPDFYEFYISLRSPWDPWSNEPEIYPSLNLSLKVNFKEKKYMDLQKYPTSHNSFISELNIDGTIYSNVIEYEFDTTSYETIMRKVFIAEDYGIVKIEMAEDRNWVLSQLN